MPKDPTKEPTARIAPESHPNLKEEIRHLAYQLYEERGREDGHHLDDWLRAEAEASGTATKAAGA